jgi:hypothetical protein
MIRAPVAGAALFMCSREKHDETAKRCQSIYLTGLVAREYRHSTRVA